jgi:hypothetical protein
MTAVGLAVIKSIRFVIQLPKSIKFAWEHSENFLGLHLWSHFTRVERGLSTKCRIDGKGLPNVRDRYVERRVKRCRMQVCIEGRNGIEDQNNCMGHWKIYLGKAFRVP